MTRIRPDAPLRAAAPAPESPTWDATPPEAWPGPLPQGPNRWSGGSAAVSSLIRLSAVARARGGRLEIAPTGLGVCDPWPATTVRGGRRQVPCPHAIAPLPGGSCRVRCATPWHRHRTRAGPAPVRRLAGGATHRTHRVTDFG